MPSVTVDRGAWRKLYNLVKKTTGASVKVGVFDGELAVIAAVQEYGSPLRNIPARPAVRQTFENHRGELIALQAKIAQAIIAGKLDEVRAMTLLGMWAAGAIKATITSEGNFAPLAPATVRAKGSSKPLIDTGQLVGAITFVVVP
jgi:hypothetical protein